MQAGRNPENASIDRRPHNASSRRGARRHGEDMAACAGTLLQALAVTSSGMGWRPLDRGSNVRQASLSDKDTKRALLQSWATKAAVMSHAHQVWSCSSDSRRQTRGSDGPDSTCNSLKPFIHARPAGHSLVVPLPVGRCEHDLPSATSTRHSARSKVRDGAVATGRSPICQFLVKQRLLRARCTS